MNDEQIALARRAVACKGWRWAGGMLTTCGLRLTEGDAEYAIGHRAGDTRSGGGWYDGEAAGLLPDLTDPATLGCLLALVREAWQDAEAYAFPVRDGYSVRSERWCVTQIASTQKWFYGWSEAEALVAALEAAP